MKRRGRTEQAILGCLTLRPMTGYDIKQFVAESIGNFWSESFGQIYPALHRMQDRGWIEPIPDLVETGGRAKRSYQITPRGHEVLAEWLEEPPQAAPGRNELLLKIFFGNIGGRDALLRHVEEREQRTLEDLDRYRRIRSQLGDPASTADARAFWLLTVRYGELEREAHLAWCREAANVLRDLQLEPQQRAADGKGSGPGTVSQTKKEIAE